MKKEIRRWACMRADTENFGWVLKVFRSVEAADGMVSRKINAVSRGAGRANVMGNLMYYVHEVGPNVKKDDRIRV
jgi:hypothetical protein